MDLVRPSLVPSGLARGNVGSSGGYSMVPVVCNAVLRAGSPCMDRRKLAQGLESWMKPCSSSGILMWL